MHKKLFTDGRELSFKETPALEGNTVKHVLLKALAIWGKETSV